MEKPRAKSNRLKEIFFIVLLFLFCFAISSPKMENDTYWILNLGRYILGNGFPVIDPFTIHEGLNLIIQQWLSDVIFSEAFRVFGQLGIYSIMFIVFFANCFVLYKILITVSKDNKNMAMLLTLAACIFINLLIKARPQIFSQLIFLFEILMLERYVLHKKKRYLLLLILLSVLLINMHAAIWVMFFVLFLPYIADGIKRFKFAEGYGVLPLILTLVASFMVGIINPYGIDNMLYFSKAYGVDIINKNILEMLSPDFKSGLGIFVFMLIMLCGIVLKMKGRASLRHLLLASGTLYMGLSSIRSLFFFFICAAIFMANYLSENRKLDHIFANRGKEIITYIAIFVVLISAIAIKPHNAVKDQSDFEPIGAVEYIKQNVDLDKMRLFNDFESGGYIEFNGLKAFIDSRCEMFLKQVNKKEDIFTDYMNYRTGMIYYKDLVEKYDITHFLVRKNDPMTKYLLKDEQYKTMYSDDKFVLLQVD